MTIELNGNALKFAKMTESKTEVPHWNYKVDDNARKNLEKAMELTQKSNDEIDGFIDGFINDMKHFENGREYERMKILEILCQDGDLYDKFGRLLDYLGGELKYENY